MMSPDELSESTAPDRSRRFVLPGFLLLVTALEVLLHPLFDRKTDFGVFYYAAEMLRHGDRHRLYDLAAQLSYQSRFGRPPGLLFFYPAVVLLPYVLLAFLPMWLGFGVWTGLNLGLLSSTALRLNRHFRITTGDWPVLIALASYPAAECLANGQVSIIIFALFTASFFAWRRGREGLAGVLLGLTGFKFQLLAGFVAIACLRKHRRFLGGVLAGFVPLAALSVWIVGPAEILKYPAFLRAAAAHGRPEVDPLAMANVRGLLFLILRHDPPLWAVVLVSAVIVVWAAAKWTDLDSGFSIAVIATLLVSYHMNPPELTLLLLPISVFVTRIRRERRWDLIVPFGFFAFPVMLLALHIFSVLALALVALAIALAHSTPLPKTIEAATVG